MCNSFSLFSFSSGYLISIFQPWTNASWPTLCHISGAVIHQKSWELHWKEGNKCSYWTKESHGEAFNPPVAGGKKKSHDHLFCFQRTQRLGVRMWELVKAVALHGQSHLTAHLSLNSTPSSLAAPSFPHRGPMMVSPSSQQYMASSFLGITVIIYRTNGFSLPA